MTRISRRPPSSLNPGLRLLPLAVAMAGILSTPAHALARSEANGGSLAYTDHSTSIGVGIDDQGELSAELRHILNATSTSGLVAEAWLQEAAGGVKLSMNWIPADSESRPDRSRAIRKAFAAIDQNDRDARKVSLGGGLENQDGFIAAYLSHAISGRHALSTTQESATHTVNGVDNGRPYIDTITTNTITERYEQAFDWGIGVRAGRYVQDSQLRLALGFDHEWGDQDARQTTFSVEAEKFFTASPWSAMVRGEFLARDNVGLGVEDNDSRIWLIFRYAFGQPARRPATYPVARTAEKQPAAYQTAPVSTVPSRTASASSAPSTSTQAAKPASTVVMPASGAAVAFPVATAAPSTEPTFASHTVSQAVAAPAQAQTAASTQAPAPTTRTEKRLVKTTASIYTDTHFKFDSAKLTRDAVNELDQVIQVITGSGFSDVITLTGHTCDIGDEAYNDRLSLRRAEAVKKYLHAKGGVDEARIVTQGMGERRPKHPNTRAERPKNRRVDMEFLSYVDKEELIEITEPLFVTPPIPTPSEPSPTSSVTKPASGSAQAATTLGNPPSQPDSGTATSSKPVASDPVDKRSDDRSDSGMGSDKPPAPPQPAVVIQREIVELEPAWIQYGLLNTIPHKRTVDTYQTSVVRTSESSSREYINRVPTAGDDRYTISSPAAISLAVLNNDSDPDGDSLHIENVGQPGSGTVSITGNTLTYVPAAGAGNGVVQFTYTASDGKGGSVTANVTLDLNLVFNNAPRAIDDRFSVSGHVNSLLDVLANDSDPDGDSLTLLSYSQPLAGALSTSGSQLLFSPYAPFTSTTFTYTIEDGHGGTATATVTLIDP